MSGVDLCMFRKQLGNSSEVCGLGGGPPSLVGREGPLMSALTQREVGC